MYPTQYSWLFFISMHSLYNGSLNFPKLVNLKQTKQIIRCAISAFMIAGEYVHIGWPEECCRPEVVSPWAWTPRLIDLCHTFRHTCAGVTGRLINIEKARPSTITVGKGKKPVSPSLSTGRLMYKCTRCDFRITADRAWRFFGRLRVVKSEGFTEPNRKQQHSLWHSVPRTLNRPPANSL